MLRCSLVAVPCLFSHGNTSGCRHRQQSTWELGLKAFKAQSHKYHDMTTWAYECSQSWVLLCTSPQTKSSAVFTWSTILTEQPGFNTTVLILSEITRNQQQTRHATLIMIGGMCIDKMGQQSYKSKNLCSTDFSVLLSCYTEILSEKGWELWCDKDMDKEQVIAMQWLLRHGLKWTVPTASRIQICLTFSIRVSEELITQARK